MATESIGWSDYDPGIGTEPGEKKKLADSNDALSNKETFLQLLVAQIKNQNPLAPQDGTQFLSQLAQFSAVEQSMAIRQELQSLRKAVEQIQARLDINTQT